MDENRVDDEEKIINKGKVENNANRPKAKYSVIQRLLKKFFGSNQISIIVDHENDLSEAVKEIVDFIFKDLNHGSESGLNDFSDYLNNHDIGSQKLYHWLLKNQLDSNSIFLLGYFDFEINKNYENAFSLFMNASRKNHTLATYYVGKSIKHGYGTTKEQQLARHYFGILASNDHAVAQFEIGCSFETVEKDLVKAACWYERAARNGHNGALRNLAFMYKHGEGVTQDHTKAFELFRELAERGDIPGLLMLEHCYKNGVGTPIDTQRADKAHRKAANLGYRSPYMDRLAIR